MNIQIQRSRTMQKKRKRDTFKNRHTSACKSPSRDYAVYRHHPHPPSVISISIYINNSHYDISLITSPPQKLAGLLSTSPPEIEKRSRASKQIREASQSTVKHYYWLSTFVAAGSSLKDVFLSVFDPQSADTPQT